MFFFQNFKKHSLKSEKILWFTFRSESSDVDKKWTPVAFISQKVSQKWVKTLS